MKPVKLHATGLPVGRVAAFVVAALLLAGCSSEHKSDHQGAKTVLPVVQTQAVEARVVETQVMEEVVSTVRSKTTADIAAQLTGHIEQMPAQLGDVVEAGDLLVKISETEIRARLLQAEAELRRARSTLERTQTLRQSDAASESDLEEAEARFRTAEGMVEEVNTILGYATIRAPFNGVVTRDMADSGDLATPGRILLTLEDPDNLQAEAEVPEALALNIEVGQKIPVAITSAGIRLIGGIREISPAADPVSRTFLTKIDLPPHERLRSGQFARAHFPAKTVQSLMVPKSAVVPIGQIERIFVVQDGHAELRIIKTGAAMEDAVEITGGLEPGELVVTSNNLNLHDKQPLDVEVIDWDPVTLGDIIAQSGENKLVAHN